MRLNKSFAFLATTVMALAAIVGCQEEKLDTPDSLSVEPASDITFEAAGNEDVTLQVTTNVDSWDYKTPDWITASKKESALVVNAEENTTGEQRIGRIVISAGKTAPVKINVLQNAAGEGGEDQPGESITGPKAKLVAATEDMYTFGKDGSLVFKIKMTTEQAAGEEMKAELIYDPNHLAEYNQVNKTSYYLFAEESVNLEGLVLTIPAGAKESNEVEVKLQANDKVFPNMALLVPIKAKRVQNISFDRYADRANFIVMKTGENKKEVKNVLYFEVNDVNPLNALEYVLEDGTPFYDAVILFAANINYDSTNDLIKLTLNPNVRALLKDTDTYIQPLRKAGIKVYLGLLGNGDPAGLAQLSVLGAQDYARQVARACKQYRLDGVNLDDEYSKEPILNNKWFAPIGPEAGSRLAYEIHKELEKECFWPTEVSHFALKGLSKIVPVADGGVTHQPEEFIDFYCSNYAKTPGQSSAAEPYGNFTRKNCTAAAFELNRANMQAYNIATCTEANAKKWKADGYGWVMWFAFNPVPLEFTNSTANKERSVGYMEKVCRGLYGQELLPAKHFYKKIGEGSFDPKPYPFE